MRALIFNADDYGLSPAVSAGILDARAGVVRATSVMANFVTSEQAQRLEASGMSYAAHLNLSTGMPLSEDYPAELLKSDGSFDKGTALDPATWQQRELRDAAIREWGAQLKRLHELGLRVDHLDSHHHTHLLEPLFPVAAALALVQGLPLRCRAEQRGTLEKLRIAAPDSLVETYFGAGQIGRAELLAALSQAEGEVVEVMCHPGRVDEQLQRWSGYTDEREQELAVLADPTLADELSALGWHIAGWEALRTE